MNEIGTEATVDMATHEPDVRGDLIAFSEYQCDAAKTAVYPEVLVPGPPVPADGRLQSSHLEGLGVVYPAMGLAGEAGEFANKVKKLIRDNHGFVSLEKRNELGKELGDVLWYLSACATEIGFDLDVIASENRDKLFSRKERDQIKGSGDTR